MTLELPVTVLGIIWMPGTFALGTVRYKFTCSVRSPPLGLRRLMVIVTGVVDAAPAELKGSYVRAAFCVLAKLVMSHV